MDMRTFLVVAVVTVLPTAAIAAPEHLDWGANLHSGASSCPSGPLVVNVVQKVTNDADSGVAGNAWAFDDLVRQIKVVQTGSDTFCATVSYQGNLTTNPGLSPGGAGTVGDGVVGAFEGGYVPTNFTATLKATPLQRTRGSIGTFDYDCALSFVCPGAVDWTTFYFQGVSGFDLAWWGWIYHGGNNGTWTNASTGNTGDITGN